jgi:nucleotide-binding universal stress UspA family protein
MLLATDGNGKEVLASWPVVRRFVGRESAVEVLTVVGPSSNRPRSVPGSWGDPYTGAEIHDVFELPLPGGGLKRTIREGRPGAEIERRARESHAHLVVLGLGVGGPTGPTRLGSTTREVAWRSPCSILMVRPPQVDAEALVGRTRDMVRKRAS